MPRTAPAPCRCLAAAAEMLLLGNAQEGLLKRYGLGARPKRSDLGRQESLPMPGGTKALWTGMMLDGRAALVAVDPAQPPLTRAAAGGQWLGKPKRRSRLISGVRGLVAAHGQPGKLLLWVKDATDLATSVWENNRMSYPVPMPQSATVADRTILALGSVDSTTWWVQRVGSDLDLYTCWEKGKPEPTQTRFAGRGQMARQEAEESHLAGRQATAGAAFVLEHRAIGNARRRRAR